MSGFGCPCLHQGPWWCGYPVWPILVWLVTGQSKMHSTGVPGCPVCFCLDITSVVVALTDAHFLTCMVDIPQVSISLGHFFPGRLSSRIFQGPLGLVPCRLCSVLPCCGWVSPPLPVGTDLSGGPFGCVQLISVMPHTTRAFIPAVIVLVGFYARPHCFLLWRRCWYFFI